MAISAELNHLLSNDATFRHYLDSIDQQLDLFQTVPIIVHLTPHVCNITGKTLALEVGSLLALDQGKLLPVNEFSAGLTDNLRNHILLYSLETGLVKLRSRGTTTKLLLPLTITQLSDYLFLKNIMAMLLKHRFSFRNLKVELKSDAQLPGNILAMQRGYRLIASCGIQLGIAGLDTSARLLCHLVHFDTIKIDGNELKDCHNNAQIQSNLASLHRTALELGADLVCSNLFGKNELLWLEKNHYFQEEAAQIRTQNMSDKLGFSGLDFAQSANTQQLRPAAFAL